MWRRSPLADHHHHHPHHPRHHPQWQTQARVTRAVVCVFVCLCVCVCVCVCVCPCLWPPRTSFTASAFPSFTPIPFSPRSSIAHLRRMEMRFRRRAILPAGVGGGESAGGVGWGGVGWVGEFRTCWPYLTPALTLTRTRTRTPALTRT